MLAGTAAKGQARRACGYHSPLCATSSDSCSWPRSSPAGPTWSPDGPAGPSIEIGKPEKFVGAATPLDVTVAAPGAKLTSMTVVFEQNGKQTPLYAMDNPARAPSIKQDGADKVRLTREIGKQSVPDIQNGPARIIVTAARPVLYGMRTPAVDGHPRRAGPARAAARVGALDAPLRQPRRHRDDRLPRHARRRRVGRPRRRPRVSRLPGLGRRAVEGVKIDDPAVRVAFFALPLRSGPQDADPAVRARRGRQHGPRAISTTARFPKPFKKSRIELDDTLLERVVPAILEGTTEVKPEGDTLREVPRDQRRAAAEERREDRLVRAADRAGDALARRRLPPVHEHRRGVGVRRSADLRLQGQGGRPPGPSRLRPRLVRRHADRRGQPRQGAVRRTSSASTATA